MPGVVGDDVGVGEYDNVGPVLVDGLVATVVFLDRPHSA